MSTSENLEENVASKIRTNNCVKKKFWRYLQVALPCVLIIGVWSLLAMPIVFYSLSKSEISSDTNGTNTSDTDSMCSAPLQFAATSDICTTEFTNILISSNCPLDPDGDMLVMRNGEVTAIQVVNTLKSIEASAECITKASPFFCLHLLGLCSVSGAIQPTTSQCEEIRDTLCPQQWELLHRLDIDFPDCATFPTEVSSCGALNDSFPSNATFMTDMSEKYPNGTTLTVLECSEGFYRENDSSICIPSCYTWIQNKQGVSIFGDVVIFMATFMGSVASVAIILISCLGHKRMLVYPAIFIVYMTIDGLIIGALVMIGYIGGTKLFCSSRSLLESRMKTPFCIITGFVSTYAFFQVSLWWLFYTTTLFWQVKFPFHALTFENTGKNKYIHIICITIGILLPLVPIITIMADFAVDLQQENNNSSSELRNSLFLSGGLGFEPRTYPTTLCIGRNTDTNVYTLGVTVNTVIALGCSLLIIIFWSVHKSYIRRKQMQQDVNTQFTFGKAEKKLLIVFCYYVVLAVIHLIPFTLSSINLPQLIDSLQKLFICEQGGHNSKKPCGISEFEKNGEEFFIIVTVILNSLFPVMNLVFALNIAELNKLRSKLHGLCMAH